MTQKRVLFVFTSANKLIDGRPTGWFLPEVMDTDYVPAAHPFYVLQDHVMIDFASPNGPNPPVDALSVEMFKSDDESQKFLEDIEVTSKLSSAKRLRDVDPSEYDAVFYVGGHGPVIDLATDPTNTNLVNEFYRAGKVVSAVCHGQGGLVGATSRDGKSIFDGRRVTGFSNVEEEQGGMKKGIPFMLETRMIELGGKYEKASEPWGAYVTTDGTLILGQNPASAKGVGEAILKALE